MSGSPRVPSKQGNAGGTGDPDALGASPSESPAADGQDGTMSPLPAAMVDHSTKGGSSAGAKPHDGPSAATESRSQTGRPDAASPTCGSSAREKPSDPAGQACSQGGASPGTAPVDGQGGDQAGGGAVGAGQGNGSASGELSQAEDGQANGERGEGQAATPSGTSAEAGTVQNGGLGGLQPGNGSAPLGGGEAPPKGSITDVDRIEVEAIAPNELPPSLSLPVSGMIIKPDHLNPQTARGRHTVEVCEEYSEGSPEDLYLEQIPPSRRALVRRYFANLRRQMAPLDSQPTSQPTETTPEQP